MPRQTRRIAADARRGVISIILQEISRHSEEDEDDGQQRGHTIARTFTNGERVTLRRIEKVVQSRAVEVLALSDPPTHPAGAQTSAARLRTG